MRFLVLLTLIAAVLASSRIRTLRSQHMNFNNGQCNNQKYHNWMHVLAGKSNWSTNLMTALIVPASHDAGCKVGAMVNQVSGVSPNLYETQDLSVGEQLCQGYRMFDIRFTPYLNKQLGTNEWRIFHGDLGTGYFTQAFIVISEIKQFVNNHPGEIVFFRLKISGGSSTEKIALFARIEQELRDSLVPDTPNLATLKISDVLALPRMNGATQGTNAGRVILLDMGETIKVPQTGKKTIVKFTSGFPLEHYAFNAKALLTGRFSSDGRTGGLLADLISPLGVDAVLSKQLTKLAEFKTSSQMGNMLFGWWYTRTGGVIRNTTPVQFTTHNPYDKVLGKVKPSINFIGNAFWVDFAGVPSLHGRTVGTDDPVVDFVVDLNHLYSGLIGESRYFSPGHNPWGPNYTPLL